MIMVIILAVLALIVVKALAESPWGTFTVAATIPIAILMGLYLRYIRPGKIVEVSIIGFVLLMLAIWCGGMVAAHPTLGPGVPPSTGTHADLDADRLRLRRRGAAGVAAAGAARLPVHLPQDRHHADRSAIGHRRRDARPADAGADQVRRTAPARSGPASLFPFLFITIACGAVSGFHALISSGTTPKLIANEGAHPAMIGYGGMLMESFVAIMALVAACVIAAGRLLRDELARPPSIGTDRRIGGRSDLQLGLRASRPRC